MLYRHWTLYESMFHSPYVATRLGIWKDTGRKKLHTMLAKVGYDAAFSSLDLLGD